MIFVLNKSTDLPYVFARKTLNAIKVEGGLVKLKLQFLYFKHKLPEILLR